MAFAIPEGLAPEAYPLAWLLGTWRGPGFLAYPGIPERPFVQEVTFAHDGGPYLTYTATTWLLDAVPLGGGSSTGQADDGAALAGAEVQYVPGQVWSAESGYWRVPPASAGAPPVGTSAGTGPGSSADATTGPTEIEVLLAEPSGHVSVYLGTVHGPRIEIATDLVARTSSAAEVGAVHRMYGLVEGELMWAMDMAAFGHPLQSYASARLARRPGPGA